MNNIRDFLLIALMVALFFGFSRMLFAGIMVVLHALSSSSHLVNLFICASILIPIFSIFSPLEVFIVEVILGFLFGPAIITEKFGTGKSIFTFLHFVTITFLRLRFYDERFTQ